MPGRGCCAAGNRFVCSPFFYVPPQGLTASPGCCGGGGRDTVPVHREQPQSRVSLLQCLGGASLGILGVTELMAA